MNERLRSSEMPATQRLLLISSSTIHGRGYLDHAEPEIRDLLGSAARVLFVPYALHDRDAYAAHSRRRFEAMGYALDSVHQAATPATAIDDAEAIFIGGGNTFRLLNCLYQFGLLDHIRRKVAGGMPYIGSSAGTNVAAPTIKTTNDMPIVEPPSFEALSLVSYQINPHYLDPDPASTHMGETREQRIRQFLEENAMPVVGLREGAMLRSHDGTTIVKGTSNARIFRRGLSPLELPPGSSLSEVVE
jgi:dipeptidase E